jgi:uncharacterized protein (TIGR02300 family)
MKMARPELGLKRACQSCTSRFYDLMKTPIVCPKCGTVFEVFTTAPIGEMEEDALDPATKVATLVSLDEADIDISDKVLGVEDDIDLGDDDDDSTFLAEDEDENDDVSGLIDSPITEEEES